MVYKSRKFVCTECQRHRRRCTRTSQGRCLRCERLDRKCVPSAEQNNFYDVNLLEAQIEQLEDAIREMETQMQNLSHPSNDDRAIIRQNNNNNIKPVTPTSVLQSNLILNLMYRWRFQIKNGTFQIETGIRNISDLLQFNPDISYLSPLSSNISSDSSSSSSRKNSTDSSNEEGESGLIMHFGAQSGSLVPFTIKLLTQCAKKHLQQNVTQQLPSSLLMHSGLIMDQLISIYFSCHNTYSPMIHQNPFMEKYRQLQDPMADLLSVCICCHVCANPCNHIFFTSMERRSMADFFYGKAKSIILDQFDLPEKRLDNVIGINLLIKYLHANLKIKECRQLILMAFQICVDLKDDFKLRSPDSDQSEGMDLLHYVLFSRHVMFTLRLRRTMDFISNEIVNDSSFRFPPWGYMDDEPEEIKRFVQAQNWLLGLFNHSFVMNFMSQVNRIHVGLVCRLNFESVIRVEDVIKEWSGSIPAEFRLCDDLKDVDLCKAAIDKTTDCVLLMSFINFHVALVSMYTCLLQPIVLGSDNDKLISIVQQRSLENSLDGCRLLIYAVKRISEAASGTSCHSILAAAYHLFHAIDVLISLSLSPNAHLAKEARITMKACLKEVDAIEFMQEYYVPANASPFFSGMMDVNDASTFNLGYYDQYPQPWFAMTYDSSHYIASLK